MAKGIFHRAELLFGASKMDKLAEQNVIIFGIGGVGSWCAESLVRTGIHNITLVDSDRVCVTNINRQLQATSKTVGQVKTEALKERLLEINPNANVTTLQKIYCAENHKDFELGKYSVIIDAIDSLSNKIHLIEQATETEALFISSMGAALKIDATRIKVGNFWEVRGCPLARRMRKMFRRKDKLVKDFLCVYSDEILPNIETDSTCGTEKCLCPKTEHGPGDPELVNHEWCSLKASINGSLAHITAIYGFTIAGLVLQEIYKRD